MVIRFAASYLSQNAMEWVISLYISFGVTSIIMYVLYRIGAIRKYFED